MPSLSAVLGVILCLMIQAELQTLDFFELFEQFGTCINRALVKFARQITQVFNLLHHRQDEVIPRQITPPLTKAQGVQTTIGFEDDGVLAVTQDDLAAFITYGHCCLRGLFLLH
jgi:hypothetical protein